MMREVFFCSSNTNKFTEFTAILKDKFPEVFSKVKFLKADIDLPELQGEPEDICTEKCRLAFEKLQHPVLVEDTSLGFNAFNGLPGPYIKWFLEKLKPEGLHAMLRGQEDRRAIAMTIVAYWDGKSERPLLFRGITEGVIVSPRGATTFGWDPIFQPMGCEHTYAEMQRNEKNSVSHRGKAVTLLGTFSVGTRSTGSMQSSPLQQRRGGVFHEETPRSESEPILHGAVKWSWLNDAVRSSRYMKGGKRWRKRRTLVLGGIVVLCLTFGVILYTWSSLNPADLGIADIASVEDYIGVTPKRMHGRIGVNAEGTPLWNPIPASLNDMNIDDELRKGGGFNIRLSDSLSLDRDVPDNRDPRCKAETFNLTKLPQASVVIIFHNEAFSTLMRSVHSVLNRTPPSLLKEIILVDDASTSPHLRSSDIGVPSQLESYIATLPKTRLIHNPQRTGIVGARLLGIRNVTASIFVVLDSHIEVQPGWLEPLVSRISEDERTIIMPQVDGIEAGTLKLNRAGIGCTLGMIWTLMEHAFDPSDRNPKRREAQQRELYIESPTMAGGLFAANKDYFFRLGAYDEGMMYWGVENVEFSFRIWQCGGKLECSMCSRVYHIFRKGGKAYDIPGADSLIRNKLRTMAVWMDEFADLAWRRLGQPKVPTGDLTSRHQLRRELNCKPFSYFLNEVWPESDVRNLTRDVPFLGLLRHKKSGSCLNSLSDNPGSSTKLGLCSPPGWMYFRRSGFIMPVLNDEACLNTHGELVWCRQHGMDDARWRVSDTGQIVLQPDKQAYSRYVDEGVALPNNEKRVCLVPDESTSSIKVESCEGPERGSASLRHDAGTANFDNQIWEWERYTPPAIWTPPPAS